MPVRDALADAETLRMAHYSEAGHSEACWANPEGEMHLPCCHLIDAMAWGDVCRLERALGNDWAEYAIEAARAAFRAIPSLRG